MLEDGIERLSELQQKLYAEDRWSVLIVFQAMDAAGKDSVIKHVMTGLNPQGVRGAFRSRQPSAEELDHDFLWRAGKRLPERGRIGIFNRSHYEEVLVVRVHRNCSRAETAAGRSSAKRHLAAALRRHPLLRAPSGAQRHAGAEILPQCLARRNSANVSSTASTSRPSAGSSPWATSPSASCGKYMAAYEDMIRATSRPEAPWYVVPADNKWFTRLVVAAAMVEALDRLKLEYPKVEGRALEELKKAGKALRRRRLGPVLIIVRFVPKADIRLTNLQGLS